MNNSTTLTFTLLINSTISQGTYTFSGNKSDKTLTKLVKKLLTDENLVGLTVRKPVDFMAADLTISSQALMGAIAATDRAIAEARQDLAKKEKRQRTKKSNTKNSALHQSLVKSDNIETTRISD